MDESDTETERSEVTCLQLQKIMEELGNKRCLIIRVMYGIEQFFKLWGKLKRTAPHQEQL